LFEGTAANLLAEAIFVPTGLLVTAFLTRQLGATDFGLFSLAAALIAWVEWALASGFARAGIRFVGSVVDWRPVGVTIVRLYVAVSLAAMVLFWVLASPVASLLNEAVLATYLRLFALDIPIYGLAQAHRQILVGVGRYNQRALVSGTRWVVRMILIVVLVGFGLSIPGAILGSMGASLIELAVARVYVRPPLRHRETLPVTQMWGYAAPLLLWALTLRLYDRLDLLMLKTLGSSAADAGIYSAAQTVSLSLGLFSVAFTPLLLSTISRTVRDGYLDEARKMARNAMRVVIIFTPVAALLSGAAAEISVFVFGADFARAAPLIGPLAVAALGLTMIHVATSVLTAAGKPRWTFFLVGPMVPLALAGHLLAIPRFGALGAACVTALCAGLTAAAELVAIHRVWRVLPPVGSLWRSACLALVGYAAAALWTTPGILLFVKLTALGLLIMLGYVLVGEFSRSEIREARSLVFRRPLGRKKPDEVLIGQERGYGRAQGSPRVADARNNDEESPHG
jgi:O-antigen/teichoic acid export membrane protein